MQHSKFLSRLTSFETSGTTVGRNIVPCRWKIYNSSFCRFRYILFVLQKPHVNRLREKPERVSPPTSGASGPHARAIQWALTYIHLSCCLMCSYRKYTQLHVEFHGNIGPTKLFRIHHVLTFLSVHYF